MSLMLTVNLTPCSSFSIVNFEQVNAGWGDTAVLKLFLYGDISLDLTTNVQNASVYLVLLSTTFDGPIIWKCFFYLICRKLYLIMLIILY